MSATNDRIPGDVLLVGSLPFEDVKDALRAGADGLRGHAFMLPDGEVGPRQHWVGFVRMEVFSGHPQLEERGRPEGGEILQPDRANAQEGIAPDGGRAWSWTFRIKPHEVLRFDDLRYGQFAIDSYKVFDRLREEGVIEPHVRFQVGMPSPSSAIVSFFDDPADWPQAQRAYAAALGGEVRKMLTEIPADSLAIQFELVWEVIDLSMGEANFLPFWPRQSIAEKFARHTELLGELARSVPEEVLLGYHWCYGTFGGWPMSTMADLGLCVELSNAAVAAADRPVDYVHMPVVRQPAEGFLAPLENLDLGDTRVFLGLVHHTDGVEGFRQRLELARRHLKDFGIASVCGYGRVDAAELPTILKVHRECAALLPGVVG